MKSSKNMQSSRHHINSNIPLGNLSQDYIKKPMNQLMSINMSPEPDTPSSSSTMKPKPPRAHAICFPFPAQSHITAMLNLAKLLHAHGDISITFVNTEFNHRRILEACTPTFLDDLPDGFRFMTIPDGIPVTQENATQDLVELCRSARHFMGAPLCSLVGDLNERAKDQSVSGFPPVSCIVADSVMSFSADPASDKFGIPIFNLFTIPACSMMSSMHLLTLKERGLVPPDEYLETPIDWIPGMKNMTVRDMPTLGNMDQENFIFNLSIEILARFGKGAATIIHTVEKLEEDVLSALSSMASIPIYAIGPFQLLIDRFLENENPLQRIRSNLWKEDTECLHWLDSQEPESVIYINFGSVTLLTPEQLIEFAMGIANSKHPFLWVIRPDLVKGDTAVLPPEFNEATKGRAFISEWCPQEKVLNHPSVKGFLTHCGWNSILESLTAGVPMLCWPYTGDQWTNCKYLCKDWEAGLGIHGDLKRDEVERLVKELMEAEKGKQVKSRALDWKRLIFEAIGEQGSSSMNLDKLISLINLK